MSETVKVTIARQGAEFFVRWTENGTGEPVGIVPVRSMKLARVLRGHLKDGLSAAEAVHATLTPRKRKKPGWMQIGAAEGALGGATRAARLTPEERSAIAKAGALARWGKPKAQKEAK